MTGEPHALTSSISDFDTFFNQMQSYLPYAEEFHFAGGEPLLMQEHARILKYLDEKELYEVVLFYNTNLSELGIDGIYFPDIWKKFRNVRLFASLDDSGKRAELQRRDLNWDTAVKNRRILQEECPDMLFLLSPTVSVFNIWHLPDFHKEWVNNGLITVDQFKINVLEQPEEYNVRIFPLKAKEELFRKYEAYEQWVREQRAVAEELKVSLLADIEDLRTYLFSSDESHLIPQFVERSRALDQLRNESVFEVTPELTSLLEL